MPRNRVDKRPQAIRDLADIAIYLAEDSGNDELAFRFLDAAEASFDSLAAMSEMGTSRTYNNPALVGVRMWRVASRSSASSMPTAISSLCSVAEVERFSGTCGEA